MEMGMRMKMALRLRQCKKNTPANLMLELSPSELELLIDRVLSHVEDSSKENLEQKQKGENPPEKKANLCWPGYFYDCFKSLKRTIPKEQCIYIPQVFVESVEKGYSTRYNPQIEEVIVEKLAKFKLINKGEMPLVYKTFLEEFTRSRAWIVKQQLAIVKYVCEKQDKYLQTVNPMDLEPLSQKTVAIHIGYSPSSICRLIRYLSVQLPDSRVIFVDELIPGSSETVKKGTYALRQIREDSTLYENGDWKVSDRVLVPILKERFGIEAARRTVAHYKKILD